MIGWKGQGFVVTTLKGVGGAENRRVGDAQCAVRMTAVAVTVV
jgi:hypothetical protein